ncbi:Gfo/Idh/MocA family oxidoreductase [Methylosoma difficile]
MVTKVRWGIVGTGNVARKFAADFQYVPNAQLIAVASRSQSTANSFAAGFGLEKSYGSYERMLQDKDVDVVYIATPHLSHMRDCLLAISANKSVLCEKPFFINALETDQVIAAARKNRVFCMEAMWMRFMPLIKEVKHRIENGEIGDISELHASFAFPVNFDVNSRFLNLEQGGGSLLDRGVYPISLAYHLLGSPIKVSGDATLNSSGVDTLSSYRLDYQSGAVAYLSSSFNYRSSNEAFIFGTKGWIHIHEPFFRPEAISFYSEVASAATIKKALLSGDQQNPVLRKLLKRLQPLSSLFSNADKKYMKILGNGYQFEIEEVSRCVFENLQESQIMPLDESLAIVKTMDSLRHQWGVFYPQEQQST